MDKHPAVKRCRGYDREPHVEPVSSFAASRSVASGQQKLCRTCHSASMKAYRIRLKGRTASEVAARQGADTKRCRRCASAGRNPHRPINDFHSASDSPDGKRAHCKDCVRELRWNSYGIVGMTVERYATMLAAQGGKCAIPSCATTGSAARLLDVDHNHATGAVRGLLCRNCNVILGTAGESVAVLRELVDYLSR